MAIKIDKADVWSGDIRDEVGGLASVLGPLAQAGADLSFVVARRQPDRPGTGVVFLGGLRGAKQTKAVEQAGLTQSPNLAALRIEAPNKPGLANQIVERLAAEQINLRGLSASVIGNRCVMVVAFDSASDQDKALGALKGFQAAARAPRRPAARAKGRKKAAKARRR